MGVNKSRISPLLILMGLIEQTRITEQNKDNAIPASWLDFGSDQCTCTYICEVS